jgi:hypothetical protein
MIHRAFNWTRAEIAVSGVIALGVGAAVYAVMASPPSEAETLAKRYGVERTWASNSYCTKWRPEPRRKVVVSAAHCHISVGANYDDTILAPDYIDGAIYGGRLKIRPRRMVDGEPVVIVGYPARSNEPVIARGVVHLARHERYGSNVGPVSIIRLTQPKEPVMSGMSGGAVLSETGEPLAILTTTNGVSDLNGDGDPDYSADVVELHELWVIQP